MRLTVAAFVVLTLELAGSAAVQTQSPDVSEIRQRAAAYTRRFITQFSNVVTEEEYDQRFTISSRRRRLKSDFLLVAYPGKKDLVMVFRDVREVDGKLKDGFDDLEEDFGEEQVFAAARAAYWKAGEEIGRAHVCTPV